MLNKLTGYFMNNWIWHARICCANNKIFKDIFEEWNNFAVLIVWVNVWRTKFSFFLFIVRHKCCTILTQNEDVRKTLWAFSNKHSATSTVSFGCLCSFFLTKIFFFSFSLLYSAYMNMHIECNRAWNILCRSLLDLCYAKTRKR